MKKHLELILVLISGFTLILQGCGSPSNNNNNLKPVPPPEHIVHVTSDIARNKTWTNDNLYILDKNINVTATLTIQRGAIIKFSTDGGLATSFSGCIIASADSIAPIVFTSLKDDARGGDTNGDGGATSPGKGDWTMVYLDKAGNKFNYCEFYYGGKGGYDNISMLALGPGATASITNCTFAHSQNVGLNASGGNASTIIKNNTFFDNAKPLWIDPNNQIDNSNIFHNPANQSQGNGFNGIWIGGGTKINSNTSWGETEVPFVLPVDVWVEATLTLQPGVILKFFPGIGLDKRDSGAINAIGAPDNHITFTSYADDSIGGDTNNNGNGTSAVKGDWREVYIEANESSFAYCDFYYGGCGDYDKSALMRILMYASVTIDHCTFAHSAHAALNLECVTETSTVTNNNFFDTTMPIWMSPDFSIPDSNVFHNPDNPFQKNDKNGIWLSFQDVSANRDWEVTEVPYVATSFGIKAGQTLTIAPFAVVKFRAGTGINLSPGAVIANFSDITFTSLKDDNFLGDTNGDGPSTGSAGDWIGIWPSGDPTHLVTGANIHYATSP